MKGVGTVSGGYLKEKYGAAWESLYPGCNLCATRIGLDDIAVLIDMGKGNRGGFDVWFCESCARERNLIW
jgi:hypothetical protein